MQTHDNKSKEEKLSAEAELVQYHLRIDGIPETTKDGPNNPVIKQESDNVKAVLEILEEPPKIEKARPEPRTMLVTLKCWDVQKTLAKSKTIRSFDACLLPQA